jgi:hypothetical protein
VSTRVEFLPLPETLPRFLFAPDPIAGTLLRPFIEPGPERAFDASPVR